MLSSYLQKPGSASIQSVILMSVLAVISSAALAQTSIKLECDVETEIVDKNTAKSSRVKDKVFIEVKEDKKFLSISPESNRVHITTVSTQKKLQTDVVENASTSKAWDLFAESIKDGKKVWASTVIDRITGRLEHINDTDENFGYEAKGLCKKVDTKVKKF